MRESELIEGGRFFVTGKNCAWIRRSSQIVRFFLGSLDANRVHLALILWLLKRQVKGTIDDAEARKSIVRKNWIRG
jgi:hypothetical protein